MSDYDTLYVKIINSILRYIKNAYLYYLQSCLSPIDNEDPFFFPFIIVPKLTYYKVKFFWTSFYHFVFLNYLVHTTKYKERHERTNKNL